MFIDMHHKVQAMQLPQMHLPHACMHDIAPVKQDFLLYLLCCMTILIAAA